MITLAVFIFGSIQSVMEVLDKSRCWDDIQLCPPSAYSDERGTPVLSFDWTQLADTRLIGLDFLDWHKLMARSAILLCCLIIFNTMQNIDREFDRMLAALFTIGVLIITEWGTLHHISFVDIALLPITSAFFITFAKATECFRGKRRDIKTQDLIRAIVFLTIAGVFFLFQFRGEARKSSLMRPFYGLYCFNAAIGAIFVIRAFTERGTIPQFVGLHTNNNDINGRPLERPITGARRGNTAVLYWRVTNTYSQYPRSRTIFDQLMQTARQLINAVTTVCLCSKKNCIFGMANKWCQHAREEGRSYTYIFCVGWWYESYFVSVSFFKYKPKYDAKESLFVYTLFLFSWFPS